MQTSPLALALEATSRALLKSTRRDDVVIAKSASRRMSPLTVELGQLRGRLIRQAVKERDGEALAKVAARELNGYSPNAVALEQRGAALALDAIREARGR